MFSKQMKNVTFIILRWNGYQFDNEQNRTNLYKDILCPNSDCMR